MSLTPVQFKKVAIIAARQADQKKADDIVLLDVRRASGLCDYALVVSANSETHLRALRNFLEESMESLGLRHVHREGPNQSRWAVLDYGGLLIHVFHHEARVFYALENLWEDAKKVEWEANGSSKKSHKPVKTAQKKRR